MTYSSGGQSHPSSLGISERNVAYLKEQMGQLGLEVLDDIVSL